MGYVLINPIRRFIQNPDRILSEYVSKGMNVLEVGGGMGFFTIPLAKMAGKEGHVMSVDLQEKMLESLTKRIQKSGFSDTIETRRCTDNSLLLETFADKFDFALAFAVVHEVPDKDRLFREIYAALKQEGKLLIAEPKGHVSENDLAKSTSLAEKEGFRVIQKPIIKKSRSVLLMK